MSIGAYIKLMRPANIMTAIADILMSFAASGSLLLQGLWESYSLPVTNLLPLLWLILSIIGLYDGGVVYNDVFDAGLDRLERPERTFPSGKAIVSGAAKLGALLLAGGILAAWQVSIVSAIIVIAACAVLYNWKEKPHPILGPVNMGACRGDNLLQGISAIPAVVERFWYLSIIPIVYISTVTKVSRGEVHGRSSSALKGTVLLYAIVIGRIVSLAILLQFNLLYSLPFLVLLAYLIFPPLFKAMPTKEPAAIMCAVKVGVLALIVMNASMVAGFASWQYGLSCLSCCKYLITSPEHSLSLKLREAAKTKLYL